MKKKSILLGSVLALPVRSLRTSTPSYDSRNSAAMAAARSEASSIASRP